MLRFIILFSALAALFIGGVALAAGDHGHHHDGAYGIGMLNAVDEAGGKVNISHDPIPELKWPEMTMDLPVTGNVDLSGFEKGDKVQFTVQQDDQKVYRIVEMCKTDKDEVVDDLCHHGDVHHDGDDHHDDDGHHGHNGHHDDHDH